MNASTMRSTPQPLASELGIRGDYQRPDTTAEGKAITKSLLDLSLLPLLGQTLKLVPKVWRITRRMTKKWPLSVPEGLMDRPLVELRREFGIELLRSEVEPVRT